jgi:hypothetical protein
MLKRDFRRQSRQRAIELGIQEPITDVRSARAQLDLLYSGRYIPDEKVRELFYMLQDNPTDELIKTIADLYDTFYTEVVYGGQEKVKKLSERNLAENLGAKITGLGILDRWGFKLTREDIPMLESWKAEVEEIIEDLKISKLRRKLTASPSEEDITLFAIAKFIGSYYSKSRQVGRYIQAAINYLLGNRSKSLKDFGTGLDLCVDHAIIAVFLADAFEISGEIKAINYDQDSKKRVHHIFEAEGGQIIDITHLPHLGGFLHPTKDYEFEVQQALRLAKIANAI